MYRNKKKCLRNCIILFFTFTLTLSIRHYWKVNGRLYKPEWYEKYEIIDLEGNKYAIISYTGKNDDYLVVKAHIKVNELTLNMKKKYSKSLTNIPIIYIRFEKVKVMK